MKQWLRSLRDGEYWIAGVVFIISMLTTFALYSWEKAQNNARTQSYFDAASATVQDHIVNEIGAYGQLLRSGVALFQGSSQVTWDDWRAYVNTIDLEKNYPGIKGVSYNAVIRGSNALTQFEERIAQTDWADYDVRPDGERDLYTPILFLEPLTGGNANAIGFDVCSEPRRRAAINAAVATGEPQLTAKIELVQDVVVDGEALPAGVLLILPAYRSDRGQASDKTSLADIDGLVVGVFHMDDVMAHNYAKYDTEAADLVRANLYDATTADPEAALSLAEVTTDQGRYQTLATFPIFGRDWTLVTTSTQKFDAQYRRSSHIIILAAGTLLSLLVTALVWEQVKRTHGISIAADKLAVSNNRIEFLMREVNHRSKNLLGLVQTIARLSSTTGNTAFITGFTKRLSALAASQDLLVKSKWEHVALDELIRSQLAHFGSMAGTRIHLKGPAIALSSSTAQTLGMATYELATNAGKYGALSSAQGQVEIEWGSTTESGGSETFHMSWIERDGPTVKTPGPPGFGTKVTVKMVQLSLSAVVDTRFEPDGFVWRITCPASKILMADTEDEAD